MFVTAIPELVDLTSGALGGIGAATAGTVGATAAPTVGVIAPSELDPTAMLSNELLRAHATMFQTFQGLNDADHAVTVANMAANGVAYAATEAAETLTMF